MHKSTILLLFVLTIQLLSIPLNSTVLTEYSKPAPIQQYSKIIDGYPDDWIKPYSLHPPVSIDGFINEWYTESHWRSTDRITRDVVTNYTRNIHVFNVGNNNKFLYYKGEFIWFDALYDAKINVSYADLTEVRVTGNETHFLLAVRVRGRIPMGKAVNRSLLLSILLDTDMNWLNGNTSTIDKFTSVSTYAPWDYQVTIDLANKNVGDLKKNCGGEINPSNASIRVLDSKYRDVSTGKTCFVANSNAGVVEIAVYWRDIGVINSWNVSNVRFYALAFLGNGSSVPVNNAGSSALIDVVSNLDTATEISDSKVDYWIDIAFNFVPEPVSYHYYILDSYGLTIAWSDLSNDQRTDYVPDESFDLDILAVYLSFNPLDDKLYFLIHLKGNAGVDRKVSPLIAIVIDDTPLNCADGYETNIAIPGYNTETLFGTPIGMDESRSCKWFRTIWILGTNTTGNPVYRVFVYGLNLLYNDTTVKSDYHVIEGYVPLSVIDPSIYMKRFRLEVVSFAYTLTAIDSHEAYKVLDIPESNLYDSLAPYPTWGNGTVVIDGKTYATYGEIYYGENWVDAFNTNRFVVNLNAKLFYVSYDKDNYIEFGEYAWIEANLTTFNHTKRAYEPLPNKTLHVYFVSIDYTYGYYIGSNKTDEFGYFYLYAGEIASILRPGTYKLLVVYEPSGADQLVYPRVEYWSDEKYSVANRPFMTSVNEPVYFPLIALITLIIILLLKRYYDNRS